jgi:two-component system OmpR family sensor kinase
MRGQLRLRVLVAVLLVTLVALAAFDATAVTALRGYLVAQTDTSLLNVAAVDRAQLATVPLTELQELTAPSRGGPKPPSEPAQVVEYVASRKGLTLGEVVKPINLEGQDTVIYAPDNGDEIALQVSAKVLSTGPADLHALAVGGGARTVVAYDGTTRVRAVAAQAQGGVLVVSTSLDDIGHTVDRMRLIVIIGSAGAMLFIGLGVFLLLRRGLRPVETMARQADRITAGDLTDRVTPQDPRSEVGRLGGALNGMLARIEASVREREAGQELMRRFFADASHELRNPLASLRANAELYQQGALTEPAQVNEVMRRIALETRRMSGLVDDMLRLARLEEHPDQQREPVALGELIADCVGRMRVAAPGRDWHTEIAAGVVTLGDEELLRRAVDNLLANVLAHTPENTSATVALHEHGDAIEIEVSDTGPGVPPDRLPRIFDRFYRADTTAPRPGSGLGLAIVTEIATVHHGTVVAEPNPPHGLRVRLTLPTAGLRGSTPGSHESPAVV